MSYKIGQIREKNSRTVNIPISELSDVQVESTIGIPFTEIGYNVNNSSLSPSNTYYFTFSVNRLPINTYTADGNDYSKITFGVYLLSNKGGNAYEIKQSLGSFTVVPYAKEDEDKIVNFELIFTPNDIYNYIGFVISRNTYDYMKGDEGARRLPLVKAPNDNQPKLGQLNNFFSDITATKIGVQSRPGLLMCINGEPIRIGRSGVYEINNGYPVQFFNIPSNDSFILDYAYND